MVACLSAFIAPSILAAWLGGWGIKCEGRDLAGTALFKGTGLEGLWCGGRRRGCAGGGLIAVPGWKGSGLMRAGARVATRRRCVRIARQRTRWGRAHAMSLCSLARAVAR